MTNTLEITAANGTPFRVLYIAKGETNPANEFRTTERGALVEFFDARYPKFGPFGQFVSGYYVDTILGRDGYGSATGALSLDGGIPAWSLDAASMATVRDWLTAFEPVELDEDGNPRDYEAEHAERRARWLEDRAEFDN